MASKRVQEVVSRFVAELAEAAERDAAEAIRDQLRGVLGASQRNATERDSAPVKRRRTTKGYSVLRPCPIPGCSGTAAPRYGMVCKPHSQTLTREEILVARDNANKPEGIWYHLKPGRRAS